MGALGKLVATGSMRLFPLVLLFTPELWYLPLLLQSGGNGDGKSSSSIHRDSILMKLCEFFTTNLGKIFEGKKYLRFINL